jgi:hypothetical protein
VPYDRGTYESVGYGRTVNQPAPETGTSIEIVVLAEIELKIGETYTFYASRSYAPDADLQASFPWQSELVLVPSSDYAPTPGVASSLVADIETVRTGSESRLAALVAFANEFAGFLDQRNTGAEPDPVTRLATLASSRVSPTEESNWFDASSRRAAPERQLPTDLSDLEYIESRELANSYNVDSWTHWSIVILLASEARGNTEWFGLYAEDNGFFGPVKGAKDQRVLELVGYGPARSSGVHIMRWEPGTPKEILRDDAETPDGVSASIGPNLGALDATVGIDQRDTSDVVLLVDLRDGSSAIRLVSLSEANQEVVKILGESQPRSEPDPVAP